MRGSQLEIASLTAESLIESLGLVPHPTCGHAAVTHQVLARDFRGIDASEAGDRSLASVLYFLVTRESQLRLHRIPASQMYHHYYGGTLEVLLLYPDGTGETKEIGVVDEHRRPQLLIPANTWHVSRLLDGPEFALLGTTEWGLFDPVELELGDVAALSRQYPSHADWLSKHA